MKKLNVLLIMAVVFISAANAQSFVTNEKEMFAKTVSAKDGEIQGIPVSTITHVCKKNNEHGTKIESDIKDIYDSWIVTDIKGKGNSTQYLVYHKKESGKDGYSLLDNNGEVPEMTTEDKKVVIKIDDNADMVYGDEDDGSSSVQVSTGFTVSEESGYGTR